MEEKTAADQHGTIHAENQDSAFEKSVSVEDGKRLDQVRTIDVENYHGLHWKTIAVYLSINLIAFSQLLNIVGSGAFARDIAAAVGGSENTVWLSQSIVIITVIIGPAVSQAADYWGRKWFLVVLTAVGAVGSIIVARATSMGMAIAGEVVMGFAYGSQPLLYAVVSEILPRRYRPVAQGGLNASLALGGIVALVGGSALIRDNVEGFRYVWYLTCGLMGVSSIICALVYNPPLRALQTTLTQREKLARLDWAGYALLGAGIVLFTMGLSWAQNPYAWTDAHVLGPLLVGAAILIGFVVHQVLLKKDGLFHHDLFKRDRNFGIALFVIFLDGMVFFAANNYLPYETSVEWETDPVLTGAVFAMVFVGSIASSMLVAIYSAWRKSFRGPIVVAFLLFTLFFGLMAGATQNSGTAVWGYAIILGFGLGFSLTSLITVAQLSAPPALIAISSGLMISVRSLGGSVGLAIYTSVFTNKTSDNLGHDIAEAVLPLGLSPTDLPAFIGALATGNVQAAFAIKGMTPAILGAGFAALKQSFLGSFRAIWIAGAVLSFIAAICSCFFVNPRKDMNMHVDASLED